MDSEVGSFLSGYDYTLKYKQGKGLANADSLSRLPVSNAKDESVEEKVETFENISILELDNAPMTSTDVAKFSLKDSVLRKISKCVTDNMWHNVNHVDLKPYVARRNDLYIDEGCLMWGSRVIIPEVLRSKILSELHDCHPGVNRMKSLARSYFWWPGMDGEIERLVNCCQTCQENQNNPNKSPVHPWEWTNKPWVRLHADFAGPFLNKYFLIIIDSH